MNPNRVKFKYIREYIRQTTNKKIGSFDIFWRTIISEEREEIKTNYLLCQKEKMADQFVNLVLIKMNEVVDRPLIDRTPIPKPPKFIPKTVLRKPIA